MPLKKSHPLKIKLNQVRFVENLERKSRVERGD
jgi:hypothetical protein